MKAEKAEKAEYTCGTCKFKFKVKYEGWRPSTICLKCGKPARYTEQAESVGSPGFRRYKDVTAMVVDKKTGQPFWLDQKGNKIRHDDSSIRYDLRKDPHGWRATGKKVRETDKYGRRYER